MAGKPDVAGRTRDDDKHDETDRNEPERDGTTADTETGGNDGALDRPIRRTDRRVHSDGRLIGEDGTEEPDEGEEAGRRR